MTETFKCPECESDKIRFRFKVNYKSDVYAGVTEEIQCANCFMDIPANLFIIDKNINIQDNRKMWNAVYRPEHIKNAAKCKKCNLYYWEIEKKLFNQEIISSDIFYQSYDTKGSGGIMVCRLCDPEAFKKNNQ
jgi:hypothetical protein